MKTFLLSLAGGLALQSLASATILLNEVHLNVPGPDDDYEYIELISTTGGVESCAGLTIVIVNNDAIDGDTGQPRNRGQIEEAWDLTEYSTGTNGLLFLSNGATGNPRGGKWAGSVLPETAVGDPAGMGNSDIGPNDGLSIFLVQGFTGQRDANGNWPDVDANDDGVLDNNVPWTTVVDSIGTRDRDNNIQPYVVPQASIYAAWGGSGFNRDPHNMSRQLGNNTPSNAASWYGAQLPDDSPPTGVVFRSDPTRFFGPGGMVGEATPGRPNLAAALPATDFRINEIALNPASNLEHADRFQFIEIINTDGQARSLGGYWLVLVDSYDAAAAGDSDNSPGVGQVFEEWNLSSYSTGENGLLILGDQFSGSHTPYQDFISPKTSAADPAAGGSGASASTGWGTNDLKYKNGFTLFLIKGYTPVLPKDRDTNDDGVLDSPLPGTIADQVGFSQVGRTTSGKTYSAVDLRTVMSPTMVPQNMSRKAGNFEVAATAWYGGNYASDIPFSQGFLPSDPLPDSDGNWGIDWFGGFRGAGTPGLPNLAAPIDPANPPVAADIRISEVMIDPTNTSSGNVDANREYIELVSSNRAPAYLDGLWVLIVDMNPDGNPGNIVDGFPLDGFITGLDGIALFGDNYDAVDSHPYTSTEGILPNTVFVTDTENALGGDDLPNNGVAVLLVRGIKGPVTATPGPQGTPGKPVGDLDPENDGSFLNPSEYTDELVDSICTGPVNPGAAYAWVDSAQFLPHHVARYPNNYDANSVAAWYGGQVPQTAADFPAVNYTDNYFGTFKGGASPGRVNHGAPPGPTGVGAVVLNEVHINPPGADGNIEYIELLDTAGAARSLNGYYLLAIDNSGANTGTVRNAWCLDGLATGTNGIALLGNRYDQPDGLPWSGVPAATAKGDPAGRDSLANGFGDGVIAGDTSNANLLYLLVRRFSSFIGQDLDYLNGAVEGDGDGTFDLFPWENGVNGIHDSVSLREYIATNPPPNPAPPTYPWDGWPYGVADLSLTWFTSPNTVFYTPDNISRFRGENAPNSTDAWYGGDIKESGSIGTVVDYVTAEEDPTHPPFPTGFTGKATPGAPNESRGGGTIGDDPDGDGIHTIIEQSMGTNPEANEIPYPLPEPTPIVVDGQTYLSYTYRRLTGGTAGSNTDYSAGGFSYVLQVSPDLQTWTDAGAALVNVEVTPNQDGTTEQATVRLAAPVTSPGGRNFVRLKVTK